MNGFKDGVAIRGWDIMTWDIALRNAERCHPIGCNRLERTREQAGCAGLKQGFKLDMMGGGDVPWDEPLWAPQTYMHSAGAENPAQIQIWLRLYHCCQRILKSPFCCHPQYSWTSTPVELCTQECSSCYCERLLFHPTLLLFLPKILAQPCWLSALIA